MEELFLSDLKETQTKCYSSGYNHLFYQFASSNPTFATKEEKKGEEKKGKYITLLLHE